MLLTFKQLQSLPVETVSGQMLGKITDALVDPDNHSIVKYFVTRKEWLSVRRKFIISSAQILQVTDTRIIVEDAIVAESMRIAGNDVPGIANPAAANSRINYDG